MLHDMKTLLWGLPHGEAQYVRDHIAGNWNVCLFEEGTTLRLMTLATGMDKNVARFFTEAANEALKELHTKEGTRP